MCFWPHPGLCYKTEHCVLHLQHLWPAQFLIAPDVLGGPEGGQGLDGNGVLNLGECQCVMTDRFVHVCQSVPASFCCEVVQFDVLQATYLVEGIRCWPWFNRLADAAIGVKGFELQFFLLHLPVLLVLLPYTLSIVGIFLSLCQSVSFILFCLVLLKLRIPGSDFAIIFASPCLFHALCHLSDSERNIAHMSVDHGLPRKSHSRSSKLGQIATVGLMTMCGMFEMGMVLYLLEAGGKGKRVGKVILCLDVEFLKENSQGEETCWRKQADRWRHRGKR